MSYADACLDGGVVIAVRKLLVTVVLGLAACKTVAPEPVGKFDPFAHATVTRVYQSAFAPGAEWSFDTVAFTPHGNRPYLGNVASRQPVTLTLTDLPKHDLVRISFDLFLIGGWNGCSPYWGSVGGI